MQNYQTIIVGAGPAGLIAGQYLKDVLILDKKTEIGRPVQCGEGISKKALEMQGIKPHPDWVCCEIHKIERIMPNGKAIGRWHKEPIGYVIDREKFEKHLAQTAKVEIKLDTEVIDLQHKNNVWEVITKRAGVFRAKYIIGADGPLSIVRRKVFPENQQKVEFIPAIEYLVELEKELDIKTLKIFLDNEKYKQGYAWVFPKSKNIANIGVGGKGELKKIFDEFLETKIKTQYGQYTLFQNKSGVIPIRIMELIYCKNNAVLIGDAAGLADPLFKGGMSQAMMSGKIAAKCIIKNAVNRYDWKIKSNPSTNPRMLKAAEIFYSLNNTILNELGEVLEERGFSYLKTPAGIIKFLSRPNLRNNFFKIYNFFSIWQKNRDYLW